MIRTFKGAKPARFISAFDAKSVLENFQLELPVHVVNENEVLDRIDEDKNNGLRRSRLKTIAPSSAGDPRLTLCPTNGLWTEGLAKDQLQVGLLYRCAEQTLREGYEYFVFEKEKENPRTRSWRDLIAGPFDVAGYGGGPVFRGYTKDGTMQGIWGKIRLVPDDEITDEPFAFRAREVLSYLAPVLKTMSEESVN